MSDAAHLILRACPEASRAEAAAFLGRAFGLKDATAATIVGSAPIILLGELPPAEAAVLTLLLAPLLQLPGVVVEFPVQAPTDLPKIDWPRRPLVFKRELAEYAADFAIAIDCPACGTSHPLLALLGRRLAGPAGSGSSLYHPQELPQAAARTPPPMRPPTARSTYRGSDLPEITPFANQALPDPGRNGAGKDNEAVARLNELFPEDDAPGFIPDNNDITSILNRLLPDEEGAAGVASEGAERTATPIPNGWSVFLAKIGDEARRSKAVPLLAELAKIPTDEAEQLSRKVIIPVLKGVTKEEAEAAKQRFAKIGILARVKGSETALS